jgi:hypothetical protein
MRLLLRLLAAELPFRGSQDLQAWGVCGVVWVAESSSINEVCPVIALYSRAAEKLAKGAGLIDTLQR